MHWVAGRTGWPKRDVGDLLVGWKREDIFQTDKHNMRM